jgi:2-dehydro-3-deoxygalactonokinase
LPSAGVIDVVSSGWEKNDLSKLAPVPCAAFDGTRLNSVTTRDPRLRVHDVKGVQQSTPADMMKSESVKVAGYLSQFPKFDGVICLTGHHSKWVRVSAEEIVSFESYMTGELIEQLAQTSNFGGVRGHYWDNDIFDKAVSDALSRPEKLASRLLGVRYEVMLGKLSSPKSRLSGLLIGAEIASARPYWLGQDLVIMGPVESNENYIRALGAQGAMVRAAEIQDTGLLGLAAARKFYLQSIE